MEVASKALLTLLLLISAKHFIVRFWLPQEWQRGIKWFGETFLTPSYPRKPETGAFGVHSPHTLSFVSIGIVLNWEYNRTLP